MEQDVLHVSMFGNFQMLYNGENLAGKKSGETQFTILMQGVLHNRISGINREELENIVFAGRDVENIHHALQSVIYNAKKKLKSCGLPQANYIQLRKGKFFWTSEIPVKEDAHEFEDLISQALAEEVADKRFHLFMRAIFIYNGEFLNNASASIWIASEANRYYTLFCQAMEEVASYIRKKEDFIQL